MKMYLTGKFAKLANVSERTLRYYDKIGLLKPSLIKENGYRMYSEDDLIKLQKILIYKALGFSLDEIKLLMLELDKKNDILDSLISQRDLVYRKINYYKRIYDSLNFAIEENKYGHFNEEHLLDMIHLLRDDDILIEQYKNSKNLDVRIHLHSAFSTNPLNWFDWLLDQVEFSGVNRLLEIGCGNGQLWKKNKIDLRNREIFLTDISQGMLEDARKNLSDDFNYMTVDCHKIPFRADFFDAVIANHVLFYLTDIELGLSEIRRVLRSDGCFYCTTYSHDHMAEITKLVQEFDQNIVLSSYPLYDIFGYENGKSILSRYFDQVERRTYLDELVVDDAQAIVDYIMSCHGNQNKLVDRYAEFYEFVDDKIKTQGSIKIKKEACVFVCR